MKKSKTITVKSVPIPSLIEHAFAQHQNGQLLQAQKLYQQILKDDPHNVDALHFSGVLAAQLGNFPLTIIKIRQAIALSDIDSSVMHNNLANALFTTEQFDEALLHYHKAIALEPTLIEAQINLANILWQKDQLAKAFEHFSIAIALEPESFKAHYGLAGVLYAQGQYHAAIASYRHALAIKIAQAAEIDVETVEIYFHLNLCLLSIGEYVEGWRYIAYRYHPLRNSNPKIVFPKFNFPQWQGESLRHCSILIYPEQGFGDEIQFSRYVLILKKKGATVTLVCSAALKSLFTRLSGIQQVLTPTEMTTVKVHDYWVPSCDIPFYCKTTVANIPANIPYLYAKRELIKKIATELKSVSEFKIGICWKGNPNFVDDAKRSPGIGFFKSLFNIAGVKFLTLQPNTREEFLQVVGNNGVIRQEIDPSNFEETAALIMNLDLVISSCTSVVHLAGALGKPVWIVLPFIADWRWLVEREDSPWYPTAKLFRQKQAGNWTEVFERVEAQLKIAISHKKRKISWFDKMRKFLQKTNTSAI